MEQETSSTAAAAAPGVPVAAAALLAAALTGLGGAALFVRGGEGLASSALRFTLYASIASCAFWWLLGAPLWRRLARSGMPNALRVVGAGVLGAATFGVLLAGVGLAVDRSPIVGIVGVLVGAWLGVVIGICFAWLEHARRASWIVIAAVLLIDVVAIPFAVAALL